MDFYMIAVLVAMLSFYAINQVVQWLNVKASTNAVPPELRSLYEESAYEESRRYQKARSQFNLIFDTVALLTLLGFMLSGGFAVLDQAVRRLGLDDAITGTIFILIFVIGKDVAKIPLYLYSQFKLDKQYGLNTSTVKTYFIDYSKNFFLKLIMLPLPIYGIVWIFSNMGQAAFLWVWLFVSTFACLLTLVIMPKLGSYFNKFWPMEAGEKRDAILAYMKGINQTFKDVLIIDTSKRTAQANAFIRGQGSNRSLVISDTLIDLVSKEELVSIIAQVIGRDKTSHKILGALGYVCVVGVMFFLMSEFIKVQGFFSAFNVNPSVYMGLIIFSLVFPPVEIIFSVVRNGFSRSNELKADIFAAKTIQDKEHLASALKKSTAKNMNNLTPHPLYVALNHPQPPLTKRLQVIRAA